MADGGFQDLPRTTASDKVLRHKAFDIAKNPRYDVYERGVASVVYEFLIKIPCSLQTNLLWVVVLKIKICETNN